MSGKDVLVPIRPFMEYFHMSLAWNGANKSLTARNSNSTIYLQIDNTMIKVNGKDTLLDSTPTIIDGTIMVPLQFLVRSLGLAVKIDTDNNKLYFIKLDNTTIKEAVLLNTDSSGINLSKVDFTGIDIRGTNLSGTAANIDPQKVSFKSLQGTNLEGLNLSNADFTGVDIRGSNLSKTDAMVNPQKVYGKSLENTILEGLDLTNADFTGVNIEGADLKGTNANIKNAIGTPKMNP
jgi:uncharacterized protein YjbI with pentapeptide repeats